MSGSGRASTAAAAREASVARVLSVYVASGLFFMLVPGTFLGVWNLLQASARGSVGLVAPAWLQAHGHAQVFGWVGSFILGIGFYSVPASRDGARSAARRSWACWALWTAGVGLRWWASVDGWQWRALLPISAALELAAFGLFFSVVSTHRPSGAGAGLPAWTRVVVSAAIGLLLTLVANLAGAVYLAWRGETPALAHGLDQRFLVLAAWGFLAPFVWAFSARWLPVLLGLRPMRTAVLTTGVIVNAIGVIATLAGWGAAATWLFVASSACAIGGLRVFEGAVQPAKTRGVHVTFPAFVRLSYVWLAVAALLGVAAARWDVSGGIWGASRHAFTVGFVSAMIFCIGQRVLPAFAGARPLWSPRVMFVSLCLLTLGCALRVGSEVLAYQNYAAWAWSVLPVSAIIEMTAFTLFALNLFVTLFVLDEATPIAAAD